jgi:hypothetical protein
LVNQIKKLDPGIARNMAEPGPHPAENLNAGEAGRFFYDFIKW